MSYDLRDHPEVEWIERTGYPSWNQPESEYCEKCGDCLDSEYVYSDSIYDTLCEDCLKLLHRKW